MCPESLANLPIARATTAIEGDTAALLGLEGSSGEQGRVIRPARGILCKLRIVREFLLQTSPSRPS